MPKVCSVSVASTSKGASNWYSIPSTSRRSGTTRPPVLSSHRGTTRSRGSGAPTRRAQSPKRLAHTDGRIARHEPRPAPGPFVAAEHYEGPCDVVDRCPRVWHIRVGEHRCGLSYERCLGVPREEPAGNGERRADVVRGAGLGGTDAACLVCRACFLPHPGPQSALVISRIQRHLRGHRLRDGAVAVQVRHRHEHGAGRLGSGQERRPQRRPEAFPLRVAPRVRAVVDRCRTGGDAGERLRVRSIRGYRPDAVAASSLPERVTTITGSPSPARMRARDDPTGPAPTMTWGALDMARV